eukprot:CAMPEP_0173189570 /NCGR_PEP_ID=MMETSP1141-20130122/11867_1 /TAXON_ID=483371 /ORGANISM="non described non described, Strain CCMP2298" /LENGTH=73 /DNA_ID=CAMNT_0014113591 /DNA_START=250 /DNA_END=471 /DNA_ORIENTATION=+
MTEVTHSDITRIRGGGTARLHASHGEEADICLALDYACGDCLITEACIIGALNYNFCCLLVDVPECSKSWITY